MSKYKIFQVVIWVSALILLYSCSNTTSIQQQKGGGGSDTEICGIITYKGRVVRNADVYLISPEYDPVKEENGNIVRKKSDKSGYFSYDGISSKYTYNIEVYYKGKRFFKSGVSVDEHGDTLEISLQDPAFAQVILPDALGKSGGYVYIPGSSYYTRITARESNLSKIIFFDSLPASRVAALKYGNISSTEYPLVLDTAIEFTAGDTTIVNGEGHNSSLWTVYNVGNSQIPSNNVTALELCGDSLWIGTDTGCAILHRRTGVLHNASTKDSDIPRVLITDIVYDLSDTTVWLGTEQGLLHWENEDNITEFTTLDFGGGSSHIRTLAVAGDSLLWIGTTKNCVIYEKKYGTFNALNLPLVDSTVQNIYPYMGNRTVITSRKDIIVYTADWIADIVDISTDEVLSLRVNDFVGEGEKFHIASEEGISSYVNGVLHTYDHNTILHKDKFTATCLGEEETIWAANMYGEIYHFDKKGNPLASFTPVSYPELALVGRINSMFYDGDILWVGTEKNGIMSVQCKK